MLFARRFGCGPPALSGVGMHVPPMPCGRIRTLDALGGPSHAYIVYRFPPDGVCWIVSVNGVVGVTFTTRSGSAPAVPFTKRTFVTGPAPPLMFPRRQESTGVLFGSAGSDPK